MKKILVLGAGKSAACLIDYLCLTCEENNWTLLVCDADLQLALSKINQCNSGKAVSIDVSDKEKRIANQERKCNLDASTTYTFFSRQ